MFCYVSSNMAFTKPFFSIAGQKERISNVGKVLGIATGVYNPQKLTITASTPSKTLNYGLEAVANHPYIAAGAVAGGITAAKYIPTIAAGTKAAVGTTIAKSSFSTGTKLAVAAGTGLLAGSLFGSKGSSSNPSQVIQPNQQPTQNTNPKQDTLFTPTINPNQNDTSSQSGTGNLWYQTKNQNTYSEVYNYQNPNQNTTPTFPVSQDTNADQTSTASSGIDWVTIGLIGAGIYFLAKE